LIAYEMRRDVLYFPVPTIQFVFSLFNPRHLERLHLTFSRFVLAALVLIGKFEHLKHLCSDSGHERGYTLHILAWSTFFHIADYFELLNRGHA
jgi:hypothetical protein